MATSDRWWEKSKPAPRTDRWWEDGFKGAKTTPVAQHPSPSGRPTAAPKGPASIVPSYLASLTDAQIASMAGGQADASLGASRAEIDRQRGISAARALADQQALAGIGVALAPFLQNIGPGMQQASALAGRDIAGMAQGYSSEMQGRLQAAGDQGAAEIARIAPGTTPSGFAVDATAAGDVGYGLNGVIPGQSLEAQGLAQAQWGAAQQGINAANTREGVMAEQARAAQEDDQYAQQLIDLAAKRPDLVNQITQTLYQHEVEKLNSRLNIEKSDRESRQQTIDNRNATLKRFSDSAAERTDQTGNLWVATSTGIRPADADPHTPGIQPIRTDKGRGTDIQQQAQNTIDSQFTQSSAQDTIKNNLAREGLRLEGVRAQASADAAAARGQEVDAAASKLAGYLVDQNAQPILGADGKRIKVVDTKKTADTNKRYSQAVKEARRLAGTPVKNTTGVGGPYVAAPGATGSDVIPGRYGSPATTTNPAKAQTTKTKTFAEMQAYLIEAYHLTRPKARAALIASGWKPPAAAQKGRKPKPDPSGIGG